MEVMAAAVASNNNNVFLSVFPRINFTTPTPQATPQIGSVSSPVQGFGGFNASFGPSNEAVKSNRAWSLVTRYLSLPPHIQGKVTTLDNDAVRAFSLLLDSGNRQKELLFWYHNEADTHFRSFVEPSLSFWQEPIPIAEASEVLRITINLLHSAQRHYLDRLEILHSNLRQPSLRTAASAFQQHAKQHFYTVVQHALPRQRLLNILTSVMLRHLQSSLEEYSNPEKCLKGGQCLCRVSLEGVPFSELQVIGLGGMLGERALADAISTFLRGPAIGRRCFGVEWNHQESVVPRLRTWVKQNLAPVVQGALATLSDNASFKLSENEIQQLVSQAVSNLGRLRTLSLFDYVKSWPASAGAIMDIWEYLNAGGQSDKAYVCQTFSTTIGRRLLHAGASTSEILSIYVNVIHAFKSLDSRGVLLEKVAVPIRNYLRGREDTVSIIATSFLADVDSEKNVKAAEADKICPDITIEVANSSLEDKRDHKMLNWDDMSWTPDPIDAGPDYKSSKSEDVVAQILGLFEQEDFIKEVTTVLAHHLLHATDSEYVKETRLVELFKSRLDPSKLQAAEVMLKDVRDSVSLGKRINPYASYDSGMDVVPTPRQIQAAIPEDGITLNELWQRFEGRMKRGQFAAAVKLVANKRNDLFYAKRTRLPPEPVNAAGERKEGDTDFKAQILSSFFWPQLRSNEFDMPQALQFFPAAFQERFDKLGSQRKLQFRPALARVSLRLDLEDRTIEENDVPGWRASVIDAFASAQSPSGEAMSDALDNNVGLTADQLSQTLHMEPELVHDALTFWTHKSVLYQPTPGTYAVLERLDMATTTIATPTQPQQEENISALMSQNALLRESAPMFQTFIANMLRNQGPKEVGGMMGITNLLKMVLPSFTYGDDEVRMLLGEMEGRGEVRKEGEVWRVV